MDSQAGEQGFVDEGFMLTKKSKEIKKKETIQVPNSFKHYMLRLKKYVKTFQAAKRLIDELGHQMG